MAEGRIDNRTPEEIATAQKGLVKILAVATAIPVLWVTMLASNGFSNSADLTSVPGGPAFYWFMVIWGMASPLVWLLSNGYTWRQINAGNMQSGTYLPIVPALWIIFWFVAGMTG